MITWYCFRTPPQREMHAARRLTAAGYYAFVPTETRAIRRRSMRTNKQRGPIARAYPSMVGYVLVGFTDAVNWREMLSEWREEACEHGIKRPRGYGHLLQSVIGFNGRPAPIDPEAIHELQATSARAVPYLLAVNTRTSTQEGEHVRIRSGAFADWEGKVEEISDGIATIPVKLFNRTVHRHEPLENLEAA